jgi:hypothetical protein
VPPSQVDELRDLTAELKGHAVIFQEPAVSDVLRRLEEAAHQFGDAWSGSSLGYHAHVYYRDFAPPPPGARFSSKWGSIQPFRGGTTGDWVEYKHDDVLKLICRRAGDPDLSTIERQADEASQGADSARSAAVSILTTYLGERDDIYIAGLSKELFEAEPLTFRQAVTVQLPRGQLMSRDVSALTAGVAAAPHQEVLARVENAGNCGRLALLLDRAADHIDRASKRGWSTRSRQGGNIFIGHGRSGLWRELKDFVHERLHLPWGEFNRVPVASTTNVERLIQMLDDAGIRLPCPHC